jgi:hypothetical protein
MRLRSAAATSLGSEELTVGTTVNTFHDEEIDQVIAEYLAAKDIAGRTPIDVAHEIVEVARVAVPKVRGTRARSPLDRGKLSTGITAALEKLGRNEPLRRPVTPRWVKKHIAAFDEFATSDGRMAEAQNLCLHHEIGEAECVLADFLREKGLPEMDPFELRMETYKLVKFLRERRGNKPESGCLGCTRSERLAGRVVRAFQRGGELAAYRLMTDIEHRYGRGVAFEVWAKVVDMHDDQKHPYFQDNFEGDGRERRPRLRLVGREG